MWTLLCKADLNGRGYCDFQDNIALWEEVAKKLGVFDSKPLPILQGRDLLPCGISPGREMGSILEQAFEAQLDGDFDNLDGALRWVANFLTQR